MKLVNYSNTEFYIPVYQRKYHWMIPQCKKLFDDIIRLKSNKKRKHFLGTVIYVKHNLLANDVNTLEIVDSQQRITTLTILLKALADYDRELNNGMKTTLYEKIYNQALTNPYTHSMIKSKIKLSPTDRDVFNNLINDKEARDGTHLLIMNYKYFYNRLKVEKVNGEEFYSLLYRLIIVELSLGENDNAQETFESTNANYLELKKADYIRNYIFMNLPIRVQEEIYANYWAKIEKLFNNDSELLTEFMKNYLSLKFNEVIKESDVYEKFKIRYVKDDLEFIHSELDSILKYARVYSLILKADYDDEDIKKYLIDFRKIDINSFYMLLMKLLMDYSNLRISKNELIDIFKIVLSYIVRRFFAGIAANSYNKLVMRLICNIKENEYKKSIVKFLLSRQGNSKFMTNDEFENAFIYQNIYKKNSLLRNYVIYELENFNQNEKLNIESSELTLEHILPQNKNLSNEWKACLGENWKSIQEHFIHTIGNLTITGYNSKLSDKPFLVKRDMKNGFKECPARLNYGLRNLETWNEEEIVKRAKDLFKEAVEIWGYPHIDMNGKDINILTLNDNWINKNICKVSFKEKEKIVANITEIYKFLIESIYDDNNIAFIELIGEKGFGGKSFISYDSESLKDQYFQLYDTGIYIGTKFNSIRKCELIRRMVELLSINEEDIEFTEKIDDIYF
ncbi:DUF262 domain-containing protein [Clostridium butyricum]|uniref:DUF262 domain-containing protein n=1 Tax=Clostridium butyricum TaxID=1492 RepID=UPI003466E39B